MRSSSSAASDPQRIGFDDGPPGTRCRILLTSSGRNTVARAKTQGRREAATLRQGRFGRAASGPAPAPRRFARSAGQPEPARRFGRASARPSGGGALGRRRSQPEQTGAQKLIQGIRGVLPGVGGGSSAKRGRRSGGSIPAVGDLLSSLGGKKGRGAGRGRKPAIFGALGAGAAGAAAAVVKRRRGSRSSPSRAGETSGVSNPQTPSLDTSASAHRPDTPAPGETAHDPGTQAGDETPHRPDTRASGDEPG
jgi:hypothetical protein